MGVRVRRCFFVLDRSCLISGQNRFFDVQIAKQHLRQTATIRHESDRQSFQKGLPSRGSVGDLNRSSTASVPGTTHSKKTLVLSQLNSRSILGKLLLLEQLMLFEWKCDFVFFIFFCFFSETRLGPNSTTDNHLNIDHFPAYRRDRTGKSHGGILVYAEVVWREGERIECVTILLPATRSKRTILCCYRPPDQPADAFFDVFSSLLSAAEREKSAVNPLGDFNAKHSSSDPKLTPNSAGPQMYQILLDFSLTLHHGGRTLQINGRSTSVYGNTRGCSDNG